MSFDAFVTLSKFSRPFGLFSKISGPRARIMSSKSSSSPTRASPSLLALPSLLSSQPLVSPPYSWPNSESIHASSSAKYWDRDSMVSSSYSSSSSSLTITVSPWWIHTVWSDDSHICPCHTVLAIFTGTNNCILILCQCHCMLLCAL